MTKFTPHKPIAKCSDAELLALLDETSGEFRKLVLMEMGKRVAEEHRTGVRSNPIVYGLSLSDVRPGDRIKFRLPERRGIPSTTKSGTVRIVNDGSVVVDGGGRHGTPYVVTDHNYLGKMRGKVRSNPSKSRTTAKYPYVFGYRQLGTGYQGYARLGLKSAEITSARMDDPRDAAAWVERLLRERGVIKLVWSGEHVSETKMTQHGWESELREGLGMSDLTAAGVRGHDSSPWGADASRQRSRRNPSRASRALAKPFWWLITGNRIEKTASAMSFDTHSEMVEHYTAEHQLATYKKRGGFMLTSKKKVSRSTFIDGFRAAYPDIRLEA